ncbi:hypothetical protein GCM10009745_70640 [Kribbella yunnanensis]|uniref:Tc toxin complex TcA C-terminal TcB-binding domain-containing protein n=1 Tax=Kribbella yunnanensis TaxID=190194 RepID=A0ABP4UV19_9ACTN
MDIISVDRALLVGGRLLHHQTGYPIEGLTVAAEIRSRTGEPRIVATTISGTGGAFHLIGDQDALPRDAELVLEVRDGAGAIWLRTGDIAAVRGSEVLALAVPVPAARPSAQEWRDFAARLAERRHSRLHEAIGHLVLVAAKESVVGDWPIAMRHVMASQLERALIDPTGVLTRRAAPPTFVGVHARDEWAAYRRLVESPPDPAVSTALDRAEGLFASYPAAYRADWETQLDLLGTGDLGSSVSMFEHLYLSDSVGSIPMPYQDSPLVPYRDYLRTLYAGASPSDEGMQANVDALRTRFHQSFTTSDGLQRRANAILIGIVREILTAPVGDQYGFGIPSADIEAQGARPDREYLDDLISLTGVSAAELGRRYRLDLGQSDAATTTRVDQNIATLQSFFRDGYQSRKDPFPIIKSKLLGQAPFFLYYDEWLRRTGPFYAENLYRLTDTYTCGVDPEYQPGVIANSALDQEWFQQAVDIEQKLADGHGHLRKGEYDDAVTSYREAAALADAALQGSIDVFRKKISWNMSYDEAWEEMQARVDNLGGQFRARPMATEADLDAFDYAVRWEGRFWPDTYGNDEIQDWLITNIGYRWLALVRLRAFVLPACFADVALATGDYASAMYQLSLATKQLGRGPMGIVAPYRDVIAEDIGSYNSGNLYRKGPLPYTIDVTAQPPSGLVDENQELIALARRFHDHVLHPMELRWLALRRGEVLMEWAGALYRSGEEALSQRARELYKAVLFVTGAGPAISPRWDAKPPNLYFNGTQNPALTVLRGEATKGIAQIDAGLNYYGADDSLVPHLRYRTLKEAADRFAAAAKSAETDLLVYIGKIEDALIEQMLHANMLTKAQLQASIAGEQAEIAKFEVGLAQRQVTAVQAEIKKKKAELADDSGFFDQFVDFLGGMKDAVQGLASSPGASAGASSLAGSEALAAGGGMMAGYAVFVYAGITSLNSVNDHLASLDKQIDALEDNALPLAQAQVAARQRQVTIANLQQQIASADAVLALDLIQFAQLRFLNVDFWTELARLTRRTLRRYLFLGGRFAWLAERALAYEQDRPLDVVRLDYVPVKFQGITGAGQLRADLAELEAVRLDGLRQALPVRQTWSLAFDFPIQFAQLKATGKCEFHTSDALARVAHPGTYAHRIESVRVRPQNLQGIDPYRGLVRNTGLSSVTRADGSSHLSLRFEDALPLGAPSADGWVATPAADETLGLFEGSGVNTSWVLELPAGANPHGLADLADVLLTMEARAHYSPPLYDESKPPTAVQKYVVVSAAKHAPDAMAALRDPEISTVTLTFDLSQVGLPSAEANRQVTNAFVVLAGPGDGIGSLEVTAAEDNATTVPLASGVALSNAGALANGQPAQPLNALVGASATQAFTVSLTKAGFAGTDLAKATDVVLGIEYTADLP